MADMPLTKTIRTLGKALVPSVASAIVAAFAIGLVEGLVASQGLYTSLAGTAYLSLFLVPLGLAGSLLARGLWRAWRVDELAASEVDGAVPSLAAWLFVALSTLLGVGIATHFAVSQLYRMTRTPMVLSLGTAIAVAFIALVAMLLSRPLARLFTVGLERALKRWPRLSRLLRTKRILLAFAIVTVLGLAVTWYAIIGPRVGHLDVAPFYYLAAFVLLIGVLHLLYRRLSRTESNLGSKLMVGTSVALALLLAGVATHSRRSNTDTLLAVWGEQELAGRAVDTLFRLRDLRESRSRAAIAPRVISERHPDILLVTIDTVRADHTRPYGGQARMPTFEKLAESGTRFVWAFAPGNVTRRSLSTIATGLSPHRVKGRISGWSLKLDPRHVSIAERFRAGGYDTAGFAWSESYFGSSRFGSGLDHTEFTNEGAMKLAGKARTWIRSRTEKQKTPAKPLFVWIHFIDPHAWKQATFKPPPNLTGVARTLWKYDRSLTEVDRALRLVVDAPRKTANSAGRIVVVTSDHGEGLGDHGNQYHSTDLYNSQIRVPLVFSGPGIAKTTVNKPVGLVDLGPTLLELAGFAPTEMPASDGSSHASAIRGGTQTGDGLAHSSMVRDRSVKHRVDALVIGNYKYIDFGARNAGELYDLSTDPNELEDIAEQNQEIVARFRAALDQRKALEKISPF